MPISPNQRRIDRVGRLLNVPVERVYAALIDPVALAAWLPPVGMSGRFESFDLRPGGGYRMVLTYDDAGDALAAKSTEDADIVEVRFVEIVPNVRVVQAVNFESDDPAFAGTMTMTWSVEAVAKGTALTISAEDVPGGIRPEDHEAGMASSLENLAAYLAESEVN